MIRVLIVDDHTVVRFGLAAIISLQPDMTVDCEASSAEEACALCRQRAVDVVLMDLGLYQPDRDAERASAQRSDRGEVPILERAVQELLTAENAESAETRFRLCVLRDLRGERLLGGYR